MPNTFQCLSLWDKGQAFAERMAAKLLAIEGYTKIDPQCPNGGPDGKKDILCQRSGKQYVAACYFPSEQKSFREVKDRFEDDYPGVARHAADGFVFITNQKITPGERLELTRNRGEVDLYHGERVCNLLDAPKGYGIRLEYLDIELNKAEQISFLANHVDLASRLTEIGEKLDRIQRDTSSLAGYIGGDRPAERWHAIPVAGLPASSRLCVEDIFTIHVACMYDAPPSVHLRLGSFRNVEVWIGRAGASRDEADFIPIAPALVPDQTHALIEWWRREFELVVHSSEDRKIQAIAEFHARFLTIHPFIDGNGRVARALATIQFKDLLGHDVSFDRIEDRESYFESLQLAQQDGDHRLLVAHLKSLIK